ncbi:YqiJ family protein [Cognatiyoonia sp. IB215182]|uniref:YqiJ family protein n=1 Tax=Cognatiyoonia sp. IB215182 TaxID=3097353 RepID=UPI002A149184|nr:YqiJ family protein [Cognatiyoonia sp. IB215182]MDX8353586.1 YqiJ family protein [Cognatiyoonia sp. IB215182]
MIAVFLAPEAYPFSIALCVVLGLFILEIISLILGGSIMAIGSDAPDVDLDIDADFDIDLDADLDVEPDFDTDAAAAPAGLLGWLGIGEVPFLIWLVSFLTIFGLSGLVILNAGAAISGVTIPLAASLPLATIAGIYCARFIARIVAAIMPKTESTAMRTRFLGGHHGVITQGTARRGRPAEAKIKDRHGNIHYLRVEPLEDDVEIPQGRDVHVIRKRDGMFFVVDITT